MDQYPLEMLDPESGIQIILEESFEKNIYGNIFLHIFLFLYFCRDSKKKSILTDLYLKNRTQF